ncbi:hypothetical protein [Bacillus sp. FJAT-26390]|uniref:hypothetical protein n=1 Tax=Bacillus sp. FJAT-26390 TaxID=1743142 RepID=UPI00159EC16F|nr:hypothetical protein [Bacillus sp. FJAT-26390]
MSRCSIDELELRDGERFWVVIDEESGEDIKEFYEREGNDIEMVRMWAVNQGYDQIVYL